MPTKIAPQPISAAHFKGYTWFYDPQTGEVSEENAGGTVAMSFGRLERLYLWAKRARDKHGKRT